jgi:hypothetical protein
VRVVIADGASDVSRSDLVLGTAKGCHRLRRVLVGVAPNPGAARAPCGTLYCRLSAVCAKHDVTEPALASA